MYCQRIQIRGNRLYLTDYRAVFFDRHYAPARIMPMLDVLRRHKIPDVDIVVAAVDEPRIKVSADAREWTRMVQRFAGSMRCEMTEPSPYPPPRPSGMSAEPQTLGSFALPLKDQRSRPSCRSLPRLAAAAALLLHRRPRALGLGVARFLLLHAAPAAQAAHSALVQAAPSDAAAGAHTRANNGSLNLIRPQRCPLTHQRCSLTHLSALL